MDAFSVWFVVVIVLSEVIMTLSCVLSAEANEATFLVWNIESQQQLPVAEEAGLSKSDLVKQISYAELRTTRS